MPRKKITFGSLFLAGKNKESDDPDSNQGPCDSCHSTVTCSNQLSYRRDVYTLPSPRLAVAYDMKETWAQNDILQGLFWQTVVIPNRMFRVVGSKLRNSDVLGGIHCARSCHVIHYILFLIDAE